MEPLLLLTHRIPYPPNKGDKIRSYHLLRHLVKHYRVYLGCFVDDADDWQYAETLKSWCADVCLVGLNSTTAKLRSLTGLLTGEALSLPYYRSAALQRWVNSTVDAHGIQRMMAFSSPVAQYLESYDAAVRVIDFVDVDSDKWAQYAQTRPWPMSWVYRRESRTLLDYERHIAGMFDSSVFVSEAEAEVFCQRAPESAGRVGHLLNGVDHEYFSPARDYPNPYSQGERALVFTGAMDYWANIEAVCWFANDVLSSLLADHPELRFYIVGSRPSRQVQELAKMAGVVVTGAVPDVRPYLAHAALAVAPLRIARGVQNKVLEAMAMAKAVVVTPQALDGIAARDGVDLLVAADVSAQRQTIASLLENAERVLALGLSARDNVVQHYSWESKFSRLDAVFDQFIVRL